MPSNATYDLPISDCLQAAFDKHPQRPALHYLGETFTYGRLETLIIRAALSLSELGCKANDRVVIYLPNCPQWIIAYFAAIRLGAVPVTISPIYTPSEIGYMIRDTDAETIICVDTNFGYVKDVLEDTPIKRVIITGYGDLLPFHKRAVGFLFDTLPKGNVEKGEKVYFFRELLRKRSGAPPRADIDPKEHLAFIIYTGGTTGLPKGCPCSHAGLLSNIDDIWGRVGGLLGPNEVLVCPAPLFHGFGQIMVAGFALMKGIPVVLMPVPQIDAIMDSIERYKATMFLGVPSLYRTILEHDRRDLYDLRTLRFCWSGADVLPLEVNSRWKQHTGVPIHQVYGASEIGVAAMSPLDREPDPGSVGTVVESREVRIVDPMTLEPVPPNETGEALIHAATMPNHYLNKPEETELSFVQLDGKVWYRTKDHCRMAADGQIYFIDRGVDIIKYKGYRISASEIEAVLQDHPVVVEACVVGVPDDRDGERIKAMVVLKEDARGVGASDLIAWCRERLAPYKVPKYIQFRDMLPKSKVGKLLRRDIRDEERRQKAKTDKAVSVD